LSLGEQALKIDGTNSSAEPLVTSTFGKSIMGAAAYYHKKTPASVLCFADLVDGAESVAYEKRQDRFVVQYEEEEDSYGIHRHHRINTYVCDMFGPTAVLASVATARLRTVRELELLHTPREVKRAKIARQLLRNTQFSASKLMRMLRCGAIKRAEINAMDVARAVYIYGKGVSFIKGHETAHTSKRVAWEPAGDHVPVDHTLEVDIIMFLNDDTLFLGGLAHPTEYATLKELKSKNK
jgi:hypothetical protein